VKSADSAPATRTGSAARAASAEGPGKTRACPSALCQEDALLLGVAGPDGAVAYINPPTRISADFVRQAQALGHPERRFRFSNTCVEAACPQWTGDGCAVIDIAISAAPSDSPAPGPTYAPARLPACAIRHSCRWYAQRGAAACAVCPEIVADTGGTLTYRAAQMTSGAPGDG
jgi:hypothetical protein